MASKMSLIPEEDFPEVNDQLVIAGTNEDGVKRKEENWIISR